MGVRLPVGCDSFLQATFSVEVAGRVPMAAGGWVKFENLDGKTLCALGVSRNNNKHSIYASTANNIKYNYDVNAGDVAIPSADNALSINTWFYALMMREGKDKGHLYLWEHSGAAPIVDEESLISTDGYWTGGNALKAISFGSSDLALAGGNSVAEGMILADWAAWSAYPDLATITALKNGASPRQFPVNQIGHWLEDSPSDFLKDAYFSNDLRILQKDELIGGTPLVPPVYTSDHPAIDTGVLPPVLSNSLVESVTATGVAVSVDTTVVDGTIYGMVLPSTDPDPTHAEIVAGADDSVIVNASNMTLTVIGLTSGATYKMHITQTSSDGNAVPISKVFNTVVVTNNISSKLIYVEGGADYANAASLQYAVFSGTDLTNLVAEYSGVSETTDSEGGIVILTPNHVAGDRLLALICNPLAGGAFADDAVYGVGATAVVE